METNKEKINRIMRQMKAILKEEDIAGTIALHIPPEGEQPTSTITYEFVTPSYSVAETIDDKGLLITITNDPAKREDIIHTVHMMGMLSKAAYKQSRKLLKALMSIKTALADIKKQEESEANNNKINLN